MSDFRASYPPGTQLNWLSRYLPMKPFLGPEALRSLGEIGSGHRGVGTITEARFVGVEARFVAPPIANMVPIEYDQRRLPFADGAFHTVLSNDTLEHVPPGQRVGFIEELLRVAAHRVLLGFPAGGQGRRAERYFHQLFEQVYRNVPSWIFEHEEHGLPERVDVERLLSARADWSWRSVPMHGGFAEMMMVLADVTPGMHQWMTDALVHHAAELERWFEASRFGESGRCLFVLDRVRPLEPIIDMRDERTIAAGLACPACAGPLRPMAHPHPLACTRCGRLREMGPNGIWNFHVTGEPATALAFVLEPDWTGDDEWPALVDRFVRAFPAGARVRLLLHFEPGSAIEAKLGQLLPALLGPYLDREFADIVALPSAPYRLPAGERAIVLPRDGQELARWDIARLRATYEEILSVVAPAIDGADRGDPVARISPSLLAITRRARGDRTAASSADAS